MSGMGTVVLRKKIDFGKIDFYKHYPRRRINAVDVEIELRQRGGDETFRMVDGKRVPTGEKTPEYLELSICGNVWNNLHTDIICGGQCLDTIAEYVFSPKFNRILEIWHKWHLNGSTAGTPEQEEAVMEWRKAHSMRYDYTEVCEYLKERGLYEVEFTGKTVGRMYDHEPYKYGHAWIIRELPEDVVRYIREEL